VNLILSAVLGMTGILAAYMAYQWSKLEANTNVLQDLGNNSVVMALHFMAALAVSLGDSCSCVVSCNLIGHILD